MNVNVNVNLRQRKDTTKQARKATKRSHRTTATPAPTYLSLPIGRTASRLACPRWAAPADGQTPASTRHTPSVFPFSASKDRTPDLHVLLRRMPPPHLARACPRRPHPRPRPLPSLGSAHCILYRLARAYGLVHGQAVHPVQA